MRDAVRELVELGSLPDEASDDDARLQRAEALLTAIEPPVTDEEARALVPVFGPDDCYGLAWTLLHLIESAPGWPLADSLEGDGEWVVYLRERAQRAGLL